VLETRDPFSRDAVQAKEPPHNMADITSPVTGPQSTPHDRHDMHTASPFAFRATVLIFAVIAVVLAYVAYHEKTELTDARTQLNQATAEATQARADADKNMTDLTGLKAQFGTQGTRVTELQRQLSAAQIQGTDLQSQLAKSQAAQGDLRSQLDSAKTQLTGLQTELSHANNGMADARKQLDQANAHAADLQGQIDKAKSDAANPPAAAAAATRPLPIAATFEKGFFGSKYTMHVKNQGSDSLPINITVNGGAVKSATVQGGATYDMKDLESGANVVVSSDGFVTSNLTVK